MIILSVIKIKDNIAPTEAAILSSFLIYTQEKKGNSTKISNKEWVQEWNLIFYQVQTVRAAGCFPEGKGITN